MFLIQSPLESDLCATDKTRGAVGNFSEDCNLSCARHRDESSAASAARESSFQPKDLVWLDSCDKHRNEGPGMCGHYIEAKRDAVYGRDPGPVVSPRYLHGL
ncbi:hypothetical protein CN934_08435 [Ensifer sp. MMN_5]|nr:hypothetical protein CN934_08435 [Ensifer sp. MMN_5]PND29275.1 hypothetical protein CN933_04290 [Sinorhizobium sp. M4_45]